MFWVNKMEKIKTLIVDDHIFVANGIKQFLSQFSYIDVIGICPDGLDVYMWCLKYAPSLVLLDLSLPGMSGIDVIKKLKNRWPKLKIICISSITDEAKIRESLDAGASGYVLKRSNQSTLLDAISATFNNENFTDPAINKNLLNIQDINKNNIKLTPRESQILKLITEGKKNREISEMLIISLKTVESHRLNLMRKLNAHNAVELIQWSRRLRLTT